MNDLQLHFSWSWLLAPVGICLIMLGAANSPHDDQGRPILLLPDVKAVEEYRQAARANVEELRLLGGDLTVLLAGPGLDIFAQSRQAQASLERALQISEEIDAQAVPPALVGLHDTAAQTASSYLEAARLALKWVSLPQAVNRDAALNGLQQANRQLQALEGSQWLAK